MSQRSRAVQFDRYKFDPATGELVGPRGTVRLEPQPALVLAAFVSRPGELVSREELKTLVWPDTVVEADQGLNYCVRQIRAALGDDAEGSRFIETLPRRGYRFVAPVVAGPDTAPRPSRRRPIVAGAAAAIGAILWLVLRELGGSHRTAATLKIAVLPLVTAEPSAWAEKVNGEVTEQLVAKLTNNDLIPMSVVGPATTASLATDPRPHTEIGAGLGVELVLSGGVRPSDSTLFIQIIRVRDGSHVFAWRERAVARPSGELAAAIAGAIADKSRAW